MAKIDELREMPRDELQKLAEETKREMFNLRFQRETEQSERPAEIRAAKKLVARIHTVMRERELAEATSDAGSTEV